MVGGRDRRGHDANAGSDQNDLLQLRALPDRPTGVLDHTPGRGRLRSHHLRDGGDRSAHDPGRGCRTECHGRLRGQRCGGRRDHRAHGGPDHREDVGVGEQFGQDLFHRFAAALAGGVGHGLIGPTAATAAGIIGIALFGKEFFEIEKDLVYFLMIAANARSKSDYQEAAPHAAKASSKIVITAATVVTVVGASVILRGMRVQEGLPEGIPAGSGKPSTGKPAAGEAGAGEAGVAKPAAGEASASGSTVQFGKDANQVSHVFRHVKDAGLDPAKVEAAILKDLAGVKDTLPEGLKIGKVTVDGVECTYNAFKLPDGTVNVGRITTPK